MNQKEDMKIRGARLETAICIVVSEPKLLGMLEDPKAMVFGKEKLKLDILRGMCKKDLMVKKTLEFYMKREKA